jgi:hypothetical protein
MGTEVKHEATKKYWHGRMDNLEGRVESLEKTVEDQFGIEGKVTVKLQTMHDDILVSKTYRKARAKINDKAWNVGIALISGGAAAAFLAWYKD